MQVYISQVDYMMGRDIQYPTTEEQEVNCTRLLFRVNALLMDWRKLVKVGGPPQLSSGYRPGHYNKAAGGAAKSAHLTCEAIDVADPTGELKKWIVTNPQVLEEYNLYMEDPSKTPTWCHLQIRPTLSGKRIFMP